eukprot:9482862-Pyramimonas_sp.AAC.1
MVCMRSVWHTAQSLYTCHGGTVFVRISMICRCRRCLIYKQNSTFKARSECDAVSRSLIFHDGFSRLLCLFSLASQQLCLCPLCLQQPSQCDHEGNPVNPLWLDCL